MMWTFVFLLLATFSPAVFDTLVGGRTTVDLNKDPRAREFLELGALEINKMSNSMFLYAPSKDVKVEEQVVQGIMYYFTVRMVRTSCRKPSALHQCPTPPPANSETKICTFKVWYRPWLKNKLDRTKLLDLECHKDN